VLNVRSVNSLFLAVVLSVIVFICRVSLGFRVAAVAISFIDFGSVRTAACSTSCRSCRLRTVTGRQRWPGVQVAPLYPGWTCIVETPYSGNIRGDIGTPRRHAVLVSNLLVVGSVCRVNGEVK
jgi:hypothetical protein